MVPVDFYSGTNNIVDEINQLLDGALRCIGTEVIDTCTLDTDNDGVNDCIDLCQGTTMIVNTVMMSYLYF